MVRVRWSTPCAGSCGRTLFAGSRATRLHRTLWCDGCTLLHLVDCDAHQDADRVPVASASQPALW